MRITPTRAAATMAWTTVRKKNIGYPFWMKVI
jgi:hypothetical protein